MRCKINVAKYAYYMPFKHQKESKGIGISANNFTFYFDLIIHVLGVCCVARSQFKWH